MAKFYNFDFYQTATLNSDHNAVVQSTGDIFQQFKAKLDANEYVTKDIGSYIYELRLLEETDFGYRGVIGKHRTSDLPHAATVGGEERELELEQNENLLEKTFFHYYHENSLLIVQRNHLCIHFSNFARFLSVGSYVSTLSPVIATEDIRWLTDNNVQIRTADFQIAKPTNPDIFQDVEHDFTNGIIKSLESSGTAVLNITMRGNGRTDVREERYLAGTVKGALRELQTKFDVKRCKLLLENQETFVTHPVDLVADRLFYSESLHVSGRYPSNIAMWEALENAKDTKEEDLIAYFGTIENRLE